MRFWKGICVGIGTVLAFWLTTHEAHAASLYWVGADGANTSVASNWKTTDPAGCGGGDASLPPISGDTAIFDADCDNGATINSALDVTTFDMQSGYAGTITQSAALTASTYSQAGGTFTGGSANIDINGAFTLSSGTFTSTTGTLFMGGNWTHTAGGTFTHNSGTVTFDASVSQSIDVATSETFSTLTFAGTNLATITITAGDTLIATGTVTLTDGAVNTGTIEARGDVSVGVSADASSAALSFTGTATQAFSGSGINSLDGDVSVNKSGGQVNQGAAFTAGAANQDFTIQEGTYDVNGNNLTVNGTGSTFTVEDGGNLQLQGSESVTTPTLNTGSTVTYDGTSTYTVNDWSYQRLTFNGSGGVFNLGANETVSQALTITAGTFDISGFNLTTSSTFSNSGTFRLQGAETLTTFTNDTDSGTVDFDGTGTYSSGLVAGDTYYNLTFSGSGSWTLDAALDINNNFSQSAGTLDVSTSNYAITVGNNWTRTAGTFTARSGTVTFDGTNQTINDDTTFYNLTKSVTSAATLTFEASSTQTISNTLTLNGASGQLLSLRSTSAGTQWRLNPQGTRTVEYLDVRDSNNTNSTAVSCTTGCVDSGNNTNWTFTESSGGGGDADGDGGDGGDDDQGGEDSEAASPAPKAKTKPKPAPAQAPAPTPAPLPIVALSTGRPTAALPPPAAGEQPQEPEPDSTPAKEITLPNVKQITVAKALQKAVNALPAAKASVTSTTAAAAAAATAASSGLVSAVPTMAANLWQLLQRLGQGIIGLAATRRRRPWGRVVDAASGNPIPQAIVRVLDRQTQHLKDTTVTDAKGEFASLLPAGEYRLQVVKPGWSIEPMRSSLLTSLANEQWYDGNVVSVAQEKLVAIIIGMRPATAATPQKLVWKSFLQKIERFLAVLSWPLLVIGLAFSAVALYRDVSWLNGVIIGVYIVLISLKYALQNRQHKTVGYVRDAATDKPLELALVQLYDAETQRQMAAKVTTASGQFVLLPPPGIYTVMVSHAGYQPYRESHVIVRPEHATTLALTFSLTPELPKSLAVSGLNPA